MKFISRLLTVDNCRILILEHLAAFAKKLTELQDMLLHAFAHSLSHSDPSPIGELETNAPACVFEDRSRICSVLHYYSDRDADIVDEATKYSP